MKEKHRFYDLFKSDFFLFVFISLLHSVIFYIIIGSFLDISYLVSIALAVVAGLWSYLSVEHNEIKELRGEYLNKVKSLEDSSKDFLSQAQVFFITAAEFSLCNSDEKKFFMLQMNKEKSDLARRYNIFAYYCIKLENDNFNKDEFGELEKVMKSIYEKAEKMFASALSDNLSLNNEDESFFSIKINEALSRLATHFSNNSLTFEDVSESYSFKKKICIYIVYMCIFVVFIKGFVLSLSNS